MEQRVFDMIDVSIIIVNYHSAKLAIDCIHSIFEKTSGLSFEIIVVDNASMDGSVEVLREEFGDRIIVIESEQNLGFGKANNLGSKYARGKYLFLLNPDTILLNNASWILFNALNRNQSFGIVGGNLYNFDMTPAPSFCLVFDDLISEKRYSSWRYLLQGKINQKLNIDHKRCNNFNETDNPLQVAYVFGADMMMSKALFDKLGGFDPDFFMYAEEEELSWRVTQLGLQIMSIPDVKIVHLDGATVKESHSFSERQFRMRMRGTMTYFKKRFGMDGLSLFYKYRIRRYSRLIWLARLQRKLHPGFLPLIMKKCLSEEYAEFVDVAN